MEGVSFQSEGAPLGDERIPKKLSSYAETANLNNDNLRKYLSNFALQVITSRLCLSLLMVFVCQPDLK